MSRECTGLVVILLASLAQPSIVMAGGGQLPTWVERVTVQSNDWVQYSVSALPDTNYTFAALNDGDPRYPGVFYTQTLADYQVNPGIVVLHVTSVANLDMDLPLNAGGPLDVYSYPTSPQPLQLDSPPVSGQLLGAFTIPEGDYSLSSYDIILNVSGVNGGNGLCLLISTEEMGHGSFPEIAGNFVPEPSSFLTMVLGMVGVTSVLVFKQLCRRSSSGRTCND